MVTAHGDVPTARAAFKEGVFDFIEKPLDLEVFRNLVNRAAEAVLLRHESAQLGLAGSEESEDGADLVQHEGFEGIIAGSEPMRRILRTVKTVAASNIPVLITGESGTGKELIAQAIHRNSPRAKANGGGGGGGGGGRFVAMNCAAETESLLESQLFGHVRGAFTGADKDREGVFEYASGGTLFLDEIGDMPLKMQAKLLRVLETGEVVRVGSNEVRRVDVRLVSATNKDLKAMSPAGPGASGGGGGGGSGSAAFREDLYFRIKGAEIRLPPLRERREDIPRIVRHAIARFADQVSRDSVRPFATPDITDAAMMRLTSYHWPGNVRQLLNVVQNMVVIALGETDGRSPATPDTKLDIRHIPDDIVAADLDELDAGIGGNGGGSGGGGTGNGGGSGGTASLAGTSLEQIEKRAIRETLRLTAGNREKAAELLGIGERTLYRKLKEYGLR
ncbi:MAG: sigma-54-dependent Fis family transcriptional regulator [Phycisphaerales bacterium]|nr:sigma-54-dependent Fis family transcriptional regulator [Phycisphaerales bacterium]